MGRLAGVTAQDTREAILDAGSQVFGERGYEGAQMARIASVAGISPGAIYHHYRSKAELLVAVVERQGAAELNRLIAGARGDGVADFTAVGMLVEDASPGAPLLAELIVASRRDPDARAALRQQVLSSEHLLSDLVRLAQRAGDVTDEINADVVARFMFMASLGSLLVRVADLPTMDPGDWQAFVAHLADALKPEEVR